jgi:sporulation protein YlmC with PRC-barrel domain
MITKILTTASVLALMVSSPALADNTTTNTNVKAETTTSGSVSTDAKAAWKDLKDDTAEAYESVKAVFIGEDPAVKPAQVVIDTRHTAGGMIGRGVYNEAKERIGTVKDIIVDADGAAKMIVIADGEFPGFDGKLVAFDYGIISRQNADGDVIAPISETSMDKAAEFSYDLEDAGSSGIRVIPTGGFSVARLLDGDLVNPKGESVAAIDNISFKNGKADQLIVGFDKVLGLGGKNAVLDYNGANLVRNNGELDFQLSEGHAAQFEAYKKTATN